jgi:hypothetical protein
MRKHVILRVGKTTFAIRNKTLLSLLQQVVNSHLPAAVPPPGTGNPYKAATHRTRKESPWNLEGSTIGEWIWTFQNLRGGVRQYMYIGGRKIEKTLKFNTYSRRYENSYYMVDMGGAPADNSRGSVPWGSDQGPSYPDFARHFGGQMNTSTSNKPTSELLLPSAPFMKDQESAKKLNAETVWSAHKSAKLRRVLKGEAAYALKLARKGADSTGVALPVLAATLFLAEPHRNPRAFAINLMLLDLIEGGYGYGQDKVYSWDKLLWHPEAKAYGEPGENDPPSSPTKGSLSKELGGIGEITRKGDLHQKGGKLPAAGTGSGYSHIRDDIDPDKYYTQAKEVTLLIRWLTQHNWNFVMVKKDEDLTGAREIPLLNVAPNAKADPTTQKDKPAEAEKLVLAFLLGMMKQRCASFDLMAPSGHEATLWGDPLPLTAEELDSLATL